MSDIDDEEVRDPDSDLPKYKVKHADMTIEQVKLCVRSKYNPIKNPLSFCYSRVKDLKLYYRKMFA